MHASQSLCTLHSVTIGVSHTQVSSIGDSQYYLLLQPPSLANTSRFA